MDTNNSNQQLMGFDGLEFVTTLLETDQEASFPYSPIILNNFEDNQQSSQMINLRTPMSSVTMEESRPFLSNIGTLYPNKLPNQVIGVNPLTTNPRTQNIDSLMNNQDLMKFQTVQVDSSVDISPSSPSQETDQEVVSPYSPIILNSFEDNQQSSQMNNLMPQMSSVTMEESRQFLNNVGTLYPNNLPNQVIGVNRLTLVPRTQNIDSLMNNQDLMKFKTVQVDSAVDISPSSSSNYLNQNGYMIDTNTMFQQGMDNQFSIIGNNLASTSSVGVIEDNIHENTGVASIIPNTGNQVEVKLAQPNLMDEQQAIPSCSNSKNFEDKSQVAQMIDIKPKNKVSSGNPGPLRRTKVGRCPQDETPLYLQPQPQPENKEELKRWRRAKTAYEHRQKKKNTLTGDAKKIEDMIRERDELKSQIETVTAQRNTYKTTVDSLINQKQR